LPAAATACHLTKSIDHGSDQIGRLPAKGLPRHKSRAKRQLWARVPSRRPEKKMRYGHIEQIGPFIGLSNLVRFDNAATVRPAPPRTVPRFV
jgi:hypothetical protein